MLIVNVIEKEIKAVIIRKKQDFEQFLKMRFLVIVGTFFLQIY